MQYYFQRAVWLAAAFALALAPFAQAQKSYRSIQPISLTNTAAAQALSADFHSVIMSPVDREALMREDEERSGGIFRFGYTHAVDLSLHNSGSWNAMLTGDRIWRLRIVCPTAYSINLVYKRFYLPAGATLHIYDESKTYVLGAFTARNNKKHGKFATDVTPGDVVILEYFEPADARGQGVIEIGEVVHGYRDIMKLGAESGKGLKGGNGSQLQSASCEVNANCSEGDPLCREKLAVSRILASGHLCTGSLLNNAREDFRPFYLTAFHCLDTDLFSFQDGILIAAERTAPNSWVFQFQYLRAACPNSSTPFIPYSYSGADFRAGWWETDFALLELQEQPETGEANTFADVFFNGWSRNAAAPANTRTLHHPDGDYMKVSVDNDPPADFLIRVPEGFWDCDWDVGTTESGSSGCPLYDPQRRVIGQNYGNPTAAAACDPDKRTIFGKFHVSWDGGGTNDTRLSNWLDPDGTGVMTLDGIKLPNNQYGIIVGNGQTWDRNAYDRLNVGSSLTSVYAVQSGGSSTLKAGREIHIRPCTAILGGAEFHAFIEAPACSDIVFTSDPDSDYSVNCGIYTRTSAPQQPASEEPIVHPARGYTEAPTLKIMPNPVSSIGELVYFLTNAQPVTLTINNMVGQTVFTAEQQRLQRAGLNVVEFDASMWPVGVYYAKLRAGGRALSASIIVMK